MTLIKKYSYYHFAWADGLRLRSCVERDDAMLELVRTRMPCAVAEARFSKTAFLC
jgi:hypothetical protein